MSTENDMTVVTALIRPHMEGHVVRALHELTEFPGFILSEVRGQGRGRGAGGAYASSEFDLAYHKFLELRLVCEARLAGTICTTIARAAWTGRKGDGVIFTTAADSFHRIRDVGTPTTEKRHD